MSDIICENIIRCFFDQQTVMILFIPFFVLYFLLFLFIYMTQILNIFIYKPSSLLAHYLHFSQIHI